MFRYKFGTFNCFMLDEKKNEREENEGRKKNNKIELENLLLFIL